MATETQKQTKPGGTPQSKETPQTVPLKDFLAIKSRLDRLEKEASEKDIQISELHNSLAEAQSGGDVDVLAQRKTLFSERQQLNKSARELADREKTIKNQEKVAKAIALATEYGVAVEELLVCETLDDMEKKAMKSKIDTLSSNPNPTPETPSATPSGYDTGSPTSTGKSVPAMSDAEFEQHVAQERAKALSKK